MSEYSQKEFASALKWIAIIIFATIAFDKFAPKPEYYFMKQGPAFFRGNKATGEIEHLEDNEWVSLNESETSRICRLERKKIEAESAKRLKKSFAVSDKDDETPDFFDEFIDIEEDKEYSGRGC